MKTYQLSKAITLLFLLFPLALQADNITFTISAEENPEAGKPFRLTFILASTDILPDADIAHFTAPELKGFKVLFGPARSKVSPKQAIDGKESLDYRIIYTYILSAPQAGTFTIPAAKITVKGKAFRSQELHISVAPSGQAVPNELHSR